MDTVKFGAKFEESGFWKVLRSIVEWLMIICSVCCSGVLIISTFMRYCMSKNWYGSDEIILIFAFWLYFMGAIYCSYEDSHIKADIVSSLVKNIRTKDAVALVAGIVLVIINAVLIVCVIPYLQDGFLRMPRTTSLKIPLVIPRIAIMLSMILMEFYHVYYLIKHFVEYFRNGFFSAPNEYDYFPEKLKAKYPNTGLPTKAEMDAMRVAEAAEYEKTLLDEDEGKEDK
ncbi:MAG: TRAP transporter small permease [Clostridiales bacterium]|nr:TRAP transporter small permease [Clostridiales bacterium]